jgi:hypothetical protein
MRYRYWIPAAAAIAMFACRQAAPLPADVLPQTVATVWHRVSLRDLPASDAPDPVPRNEIERLATAAYEGPGKIDARIYVLSSSVVGQEMVDRWRPSADTVFFYSGPYFVVVKWDTAERQALQDFVRQIEKRLPPQKPSAQRGANP